MFQNKKLRFPPAQRVTPAGSSMASTKQVTTKFKSLISTFSNFLNKADHGEYPNKIFPLNVTNEHFAFCNKGIVFNALTPYLQYIKPIVEIVVDYACNIELGSDCVNVNESEIKIVKLNGNMPICNNWITGLDADKYLYILYNISDVDIYDTTKGSVTRSFQLDSKIKSNPHSSQFYITSKKELIVNNINIIYVCSAENGKILRRFDPFSKMYDYLPHMNAVLYTLNNKDYLLCSLKGYMYVIDLDNGAIVSRWKATHFKEYNVSCYNLMRVYYDRKNSDNDRLYCIDSDYDVVNGLTRWYNRIIIYNMNGQILTSNFDTESVTREVANPHFTSIKSNEKELDPVLFNQIRESIHKYIDDIKIIDRESISISQSLSHYALQYETTYGTNTVYYKPNEYGLNRLVKAQDMVIYNNKIYIVDYSFLGCEHIIINNKMISFRHTIKIFDLDGNFIERMNNYIDLNVIKSSKTKILGYDAEYQGMKFCIHNNKMHILKSKSIRCDALFGHKWSANYNISTYQ
jgi:hypothetical protein